MSTHSKYFDREIRKLILCYAVLTKCLNTGHMAEVSVYLFDLIKHFFQLCPDASSLVEPLLIKD